MSQSLIQLKALNELLRHNFVIPRYQRGYRWGTTQVQALLEDVMDFAKRKTSEPFYCLQPVVVTRSNVKNTLEGWHVVDGQQRLTTIFLILQVLNERYAVDGRYETYTLHYESRPGSKKFLDKISEATQKESQDNVDYHFMFEARTTIRGWFKDKRHDLNDFESTLLKEVKIIWYELPRGDDATAAFTRLNIGKIPLTDAELIRGLFLRSQNFPQVTASVEQLRLAQEWDGMEKLLQDDAFWFFLTDRTDLPNRIELIFELVAKQSMPAGANFATEHGCFIAFNDMLAQGRPIGGLWDLAKACFMTLEEWYSDHMLFHLIGFLVHEGHELLPLMKLSREKGKRQFHQLLRRHILKEVFPTLSDGDEPLEGLAEDLRSIKYGSPRVVGVLLLFNIASIIANEKSIVRFRFDYFKNERWDIEHIHALASDIPSSMRDRAEWLQTISDHLGLETKTDVTGLRDRVLQMLEAKSHTDGAAFEKLHKEVFQRLEEPLAKNRKDSHAVDLNDLGNLALLDIGTNRSYKNAPFQVKRRLLLQRDQAGTFVPLCTRNVFLKAYSPTARNTLFWGSSEQKDYVAAITETLLNFFTV